MVPELNRILLSGPENVDATEDTLWEEKWGQVQWGTQRELDEADKVAFGTALQQSKGSGKGVSYKGSRHWSAPMVHSSYYAPFPFEFHIVEVEHIAFPGTSTAQSVVQRSTRSETWLCAHTRGSRWHQSPMPLWRRARPQRQATLAHRRLHPPRVPRAPESPAAVLDGFHGASINLHLDHNARSLKKASAVCFQSEFFGQLPLSSDHSAVCGLHFVI